MIPVLLVVNVPARILDQRLYDESRRYGDRRFTLAATVAAWWLSRRVFQWALSSYRSASKLEPLMSQRPSRKRFQDYLESIRGRAYQVPSIGHGHRPLTDETTTMATRSHRSSGDDPIVLATARRKSRSRLLALATLTVATLLSLIPPLATKIAIDSVLTTPPERFILAKKLVGLGDGAWVVGERYPRSGCCPGAPSNGDPSVGRWEATQAVNRRPHAFETCFSTYSPSPFAPYPCHEKWRCNQLVARGRGRCGRPDLQYVLQPVAGGGSVDRLA